MIGGHRTPPSVAETWAKEAWRTLAPAREDPDGLLLPLLLGLTFATGLVGAYSYLRLGHVFVANMTGNVVFFGFALARAEWFSIRASVLALAAFTSAHSWVALSSPVTRLVANGCWQSGRRSSAHSSPQP